MRAYGDKIMVEEIEETVSQSGLTIVQKDSDKTVLKGKVLSVGHDVKAQISEGDIVVSDRYAGSQWGDYIFLTESEVSAVLTES